eukprot:COSAG02_NODE_24012_length_701_cov_0.664452_1_plen_152_part_00
MYSLNECAHATAGRDARADVVRGTTERRARPDTDGRQGRRGSFIRDMALSRADLAWMLVTCLLLSRLLAIHRAQQIQLKTSPAEQQGMRRAGAQAASLLTYLDAHVIPGVSSAELDELAHHYTTHPTIPPSPPPTKTTHFFNDTATTEIYT